MCRNLIAYECTWIFYFVVGNLRHTRFSGRKINNCTTSNVPYFFTYLKRKIREIKIVWIRYRAAGSFRTDGIRAATGN